MFPFLASWKTALIVMEKSRNFIIRFMREPCTRPLFVVDNNDGSSADGSPLFAMSGDGQTDVTIPMLFLFHKEGAVLEKGLADYSKVAVLLAEKARKSGTVVLSPWVY